jgi:hypothetical protein
VPAEATAEPVRKAPHSLPRIVPAADIGHGLRWFNNGDSVEES